MTHIKSRALAAVMRAAAALATTSFGAVAPLPRPDAVNRILHAPR